MNVNEPITRTQAKWLLFALTLALVVVVSVTSAHANSPITRSGLDYNGIRNPGNCEILNDGGELHVKCTSKVGADGPAFIRYRFTKAAGYDGVRAPATVAADVRNFVGEPCVARWMSDFQQAARTLRVTVPAGSYCHIVSVSWSQAQA